MGKLTLILLISSITVITASFINPYPRFKHHKLTLEDDPGEALYLTPYLEQGKIEIARKMAEVHHPEMTFVKGYSGYLTVDKKLNSNLFFWYFRAAVDPENAPVVLWLQGGPGATSLFGLFQENGPFFVSNTMNLKLMPRKYSWHLNHNLIYIDNPVGTGFSFTGSDEGYAKNEQDVGENLYQAVYQFFQLFPELQKNHFYVTGESYAGKYVPAVSYVIHKKNENPDVKIKINLKGLAMGNGFTDPINQLKYGDYLYQLGLIDDRGLAIFHEYEKKGTDFIRNKDYTSAFKIFDILIDMDKTPTGSLFKNMTGFDTYFNYLHDRGDGGSDRALGEFIQCGTTRRAIHVGNNSFHDLEGDNKVEEFLMNDVMASVADYVSELLSYYRVVVYNGQLDIIVAYPLTENYLHQLEFNGAEDYRKSPRYIWRVDDEIAGYAREAANLTDVLVRKAGHMVPGDQPKWALDMLLRLTSNKSYAV